MNPKITALSLTLFSILSMTASAVELSHPPIPLFLPDTGPISATVHIGPTSITVINNGQVSYHDTPYHGELMLFASDFSDSITVVGQPLSWLGVSLGDGNDQFIDYTSSPTRIYCGPGNDDVTTGNAEDQVFGNDGDDIIRTGGGNDAAQGGRGDDQIFLGDGDDIGSGSDGNDDVLGEAGNDILLGGSGVDLVNGGPGADALYGYGPEKNYEHQIALPDTTIFGPDAYPDGRTDMLIGGTGPDVFFDRFWEWKMSGRWGYKFFYETEAVSDFQSVEDTRVSSHVQRPRRPVATKSQFFSITAK